jgi:hypothetical protein
MSMARRQILGNSPNIFLKNTFLIKILLKSFEALKTKQKSVFWAVDDKKKSFLKLLVGCGQLTSHSYRHPGPVKQSF